MLTEVRKEERRNKGRGTKRERVQRGVCLPNKQPHYPKDTPVTIVEIKGAKEKRGVENNGGEYGE